MGEANAHRHALLGRLHGQSADDGVRGARDAAGGGGGRRDPGPAVDAPRHGRRARRDAARRIDRLRPDGSGHGGAAGGGVDCAVERRAADGARRAGLPEPDAARAGAGSARRRGSGRNTFRRRGSSRRLRRCRASLRRAPAPRCQASARRRELTAVEAVRADPAPRPAPMVAWSNGGFFETFGATAPTPAASSSPATSRRTRRPWSSSISRSSRSSSAERNPVGRRLRGLPADAHAAPEPWREIVGVVPDLALSAGDETMAAGLLCADERRAKSSTSRCATPGDARSLAGPLRAAVSTSIRTFRCATSFRCRTSAARIARSLPVSAPRSARSAAWRCCSR